MDFAKSQLEKHGWTQGRGLGRSEDGMKEAIKVKMKFDNTGVGHRAGDEFTFHWWDHMFNKALDNIDVENGKEGVKVKKGGDFSITSKKPFNKNIANKELLYGNFVKASTLTQSSDSGLMQEVKRDGGSDSSSEEEDTEPGISFNNLTDEDLVRICGGRTAHKAARHGLKLNGKLRRIEEQEAVVSRGNSDNGDSSLEDQSCKQKKKSKKKKHKKEKHEDSPEIVNSDDTQSQEQETSKKKKKSKKRKHVNEENHSEISEPLNDIDRLSKKKKRSKKDRDLSNDPCESDTAAAVDLACATSVSLNSALEASVPAKHKKSKKSKKSKRT